MISSVTVGFFDDIHVPLVYLPEPTALCVPISPNGARHRVQNANSVCNYSDPKERAHFWLPGSESTFSHELLDSALTDRMYIDAGDVVRVRVESDGFHDDEPGPPKAHEGVQQVRESRRPPYTITVRTTCRRRRALCGVLMQCPHQCSMSEQGLGPTSWWRNAGVETMDEG